MKNITVQKSAYSLGFTMVEVIVTAAIVAIVAAIAWPAFQAQSWKNRRTEAISDLSRLQVFMSRCYADNGGYDCCDNNTLDAYRAANPAPAGQPRQYTLTFNTSAVDNTLPACKQAQGYIVTAAPTPGSVVDGDSCTSFTVDHTGLRQAWDDQTVPALKPSCWGD